MEWKFMLASDTNRTSYALPDDFSHILNTPYSNPAWNCARTHKLKIFFFFLWVPKMQSCIFMCEALRLYNRCLSTRARFPKYCALCKCKQNVWLPPSAGLPLLSVSLPLLLAPASRLFVPSHLLCLYRCSNL